MANKPQYSRNSSRMFFRHYGRERRDVYLRINAQAIRVQQGNKGSVVDTLGGYFREVMASEDPQYNGLMLPDMTIECDTGAAYRQELNNLEWIWKNHATPQSDGKPAQTYFMDYVDEDTLWFDGNVGGDITQAWNDGGIEGPASPPAPQVAMDRARQFVSRQTSQYKTGPARTIGGSRFVPRCFELEILNFAWDETVQDPYRIRFSFRCKILRDVFSRIDRPQETTGRTIIPLSNTWNDSGFTPEGGSVSGPLNSSADYPLNPVGQVLVLEQTSSALPTARATEVSSILGLVRRATGIGENRQAATVQANGGQVQAIGQRLYHRPEFSGAAQLQSTQKSIDATIPKLLQAIAAPVAQTYLQTGPDWLPPVVPAVSDLISSLSLDDLELPPNDSPQP